MFDLEYIQGFYRLLNIIIFILNNLVIAFILFTKMV